MSNSIQWNIYNCFSGGKPENYMGSEDVRYSSSNKHQPQFEEIQVAKQIESQGTESSGRKEKANVYGYSNDLYDNVSEDVRYSSSYYPSEPPLRYYIGILAPAYYLYSHDEHPTLCNDIMVHPVKAGSYEEIQAIERLKIETDNMNQRMEINAKLIAEECQRRARKTQVIEEECQRRARNIQDTTRYPVKLTSASRRNIQDTTRYPVKLTSASRRNIQDTK